MTMSMSRHCLVLASAMLAAFCVPAAAQEKDELWDITMKMEMAGMPMSMPARTSRVCVEKGGKDDSYIPQQSDCRNVESKRTGNKYTFKTVCDGKNKMTSTGQITFGDGTYEGRMKMTGMMEGQPMDMTQTYSGKRVGTCKAPPKPK
jgi:ABC-type sugar transport system substrate-binding protein